MGSVIEAIATLEGKLRFSVRTGSGRIVVVDYPPPLGEGEGLMPSEALLASLAACCGQVVASLLRKMDQSISGLEVRAAGERREEHPTTFTAIDLEIAVSGKDLDPAKVEKAIALAEEKYSPVWAMLRASVPIRSSYRIV